MCPTSIDCAHDSCLVGLTAFEWAIVVGDFPKAVVGDFPNAPVPTFETYLMRQLWRRSVTDVLWCAVCGLLAWCGYKVRFRQIVGLFWHRGGQFPDQRSFTSTI